MTNDIDQKRYRKHGLKYQALFVYKALFAQVLAVANRFHHCFLAVSISKFPHKRFFGFC